MNCSGSKYSSPRRTPQCRQLETPAAPPSQCVIPSTVPRTWPRLTGSPAFRGEATGSKLSRNPSGVAMVRTKRSTTLPANDTTPSVGASTGEPWVAARSTPRCPDSHGLAGGSKRCTACGFPASGHPQAREAGRGAADVGRGPASTAGRDTAVPPAPAATEPGVEALVASNMRTMVRIEPGSRVLRAKGQELEKLLIHTSCTCPVKAGWQVHEYVGKTTGKVGCGGVDVVRRGCCVVVVLVQQCADCALTTRTPP